MLYLFFNEWRKICWSQKQSKFWIFMFSTYHWAQYCFSIGNITFSHVKNGRRVSVKFFFRQDLLLKSIKRLFRTCNHILTIFIIKQGIYQTTTIETYMTSSAYGVLAHFLFLFSLRLQRHNERSNNPSNIEIITSCQNITQSPDHVSYSCS